MRKLKLNAVFILAFAAALVLSAYPVIHNGLNGRIASAGIRSRDFAGGTWISWHIQEVRKNPGKYGNLRYADLLFHPFPGINFGFLNNFQAILYSYILDYAKLVFTWNLLTFLLIAFNFLSAFILLDYFCRNKWLSLSGALIFCSNPVVYMQFYYGRVEIMPLGYILFAIFYILKAYESNRIRHYILGGLWTGLAGLSIYFYMFYALFFSGVYMLWLVLSGKGKGYGRLINGLTVVSLISLAAVSPYVINDMKIIVFEGIEDKDYSINKSLPDKMTLPEIMEQQNSYRPPYVFILLAAAGLIYGRKNKRSPLFFWSAATVVYISLSLGNYIYIGGQQVPTPFYMMRKILPFFARDLYAERYSFMVYFAGAALFAAVLQFLSGRQAGTANGKVKYIAAPLLLFLILADNILLRNDYKALSTEGYQLKIPSVYGEIGASEEALVSLPFLYSINSAFYQIWHHRPVMGWVGKQKGFATYGSAFTKYIKTNYFLQGLLLLNYSLAQEEYIKDNYAGIQKGLADLKTSGVKYLVYQDEFLGFSPYEDWMIKFLNDDIVDDYVKLVTGKMPKWINDKKFLYARHKHYIEEFAGQPYIEKDGLLVYKLR